jgi:alkaline phosphatase D
MFSLPRRRLLEMALAGAGCSFGKTLAGDLRIWPTFSDPWDLVDPGIASGDPTQTSVVLWCGLPARFRNTTVELNWEVCTQPGKSKFDDSSYSDDNSNLVQWGTVACTPDSDGTAHVFLKDLLPGKHYYYRFFSADIHFMSEWGRTKTLSEDPDKIRFAFLSCMDFTKGYYTALQGMEKLDLDFIVSLGDNIYETSPVDPNSNNVRWDFIGGGRASTLMDYRNKYRLYLTDPYLRKARQMFPWFVMWDDHEFYNNYPGRGPVNKNLFGYGQRAFFEYQPKSTDQPSYGVRRIGDLASFYFLDQRSFRDAPPCKDTVSTGCPDFRSPSRTMLGQQQKTWFMEQLGNSGTQYNFVMNETMIMPFYIAQWPDFFGSPKGVLSSFCEVESQTQKGGKLYANLDAWDGFPSERHEILEFVERNKIQNLVFCTGDIRGSPLGCSHSRRSFTSGQSAP